MLLTELLGATMLEEMSRRTMKPHIYWSRYSKNWVCNGNGYSSHGRTPKMAYDNWIRSSIYD